MNEVIVQKGYIEPKDSKYQKWIDKNVCNEPQQTCKKKALAMAKLFPELRVVGVSSFMDGHAWCINQKDEVIDPTSHQFSWKFDYSCERLELKDFPIGKCHWCGETIWPDTEGARKYTHEDVGPHKYCSEAERESR